MAMAPRKEQAIQLRRAGLSRSQIADALGLGCGGQPLSRWLRDVPPPAWTSRPNAKDDLRAQAVAMRGEGRSYREIRQVVEVSKSTLSLWLRDVPLTGEQQQALARRGPEATAARASTNRDVAARRRAHVQDQARRQIAELSESELFVAGVIAYWAEGAKNKPWRSGQGVAFVNSDPGLIRLFLRWLTLVGVNFERLRVQAHDPRVGRRGRVVAPLVRDGGRARRRVRKDPAQDAQPEDRQEEPWRDVPRMSRDLRPTERRAQPSDRRMVRGPGRDMRR